MTKFNVTRDSSKPESLTIEEMREKAGKFHERFVALQARINRYKRITPKVSDLEAEMDFCRSESNFYSSWAQMCSARAA